MKYFGGNMLVVTLYRGVSTKGLEHAGRVPYAVASAEDSCVDDTMGAPLESREASAAPGGSSDIKFNGGTAALISKSKQTKTTLTKYAKDAIFKRVTGDDRRMRDT